MYQCWTALECHNCHKQQHVQTILVLICERILRMYQCAAARIAKAAHVQTATNPGDATRGLDSYGDYYPPDQPGMLFCGLTGVSMEKAACQGSIYSGEMDTTYTVEEQVCMVHALTKLHIKSFRGLLNWIVRSCEEFGNEARRGRIVAIEERLQRAEISLDRSVEMIMNQSEMP